MTPSQPRQFRAQRASRQENRPLLSPTPEPAMEGSSSSPSTGTYQFSSPTTFVSPASVPPLDTPRFLARTRQRSETVPGSPDSFETAFNDSQSSVEPRSSSPVPEPRRQPRAELRPASTDTIRGPIDRPAATPPLDPFPRWESGSEEECEEEHGYRLGRQSGLSVIGVEGRWILSSVVHAMVLAMQFVVTLGVFSALVFVAIWQKSEGGGEDDEFWEWLWKFIEPSLVGILLLCSGTLLAHEVRVLSSVALLYLQSAILVLTTAASLLMWVRCLDEYSSPVKGVLMGCNVLMWGLSLFGFVRAVVVWRVEWEVDEERMALCEGRGSRRVSYGTFVPWV